MQLSLFVSAIFTLCLIPDASVSENASIGARVSEVACQSPAPIEAFAASFYAAMVVTTNKEVLDNLEIKGIDAAKHEYGVVYDALTPHAVCHADSVAYTASMAFAMVPSLTLPDYYETTAYNVAVFLLQAGVLRCENAVSLSVNYFQFIRRAFKGLNETKFESYLQGVVRGLVDFLIANEFDLEDVAPKLAGIFLQEYEDYKPPDNCVRLD